MKKPGKTAESAQPAPTVEFALEVLRGIRQHARSEPGTEVCGVLIGRESGGSIVVAASIQGEHSERSGARVTFTQETWAHIYEVKDAEYPAERIVGWYHSHPGFGIFLSDHDSFIHENFFNAPTQIAYVYDPVSDEEGCFGWRNGRIERLRQFGVCDESGGGPVQVRPEPTVEQRTAVEPAATSAPKPERADRVMRIATLVISHLLVLLIGAILAALFMPVFVIERRPSPSATELYQRERPAAEPAPAPAPGRQSRPAGDDTRGR